MKNVIIFALVFLAGCAPLTFEQRLPGAYELVTGTRVTATAALDAGKIPAAQGTNVLTVTDNARKVLDAAAASKDESGLDFALDILRAVEEFSK